MTEGEYSSRLLDFAENGQLCVTLNSLRNLGVLGVSAVEGSCELLIGQETTRLSEYSSQVVGTSYHRGDAENAEIAQRVEGYSFISRKIFPEKQEVAGLLHRIRT